MQAAKILQIKVQPLPVVPTTISPIYYEQPQEQDEYINDDSYEDYYNPPPNFADDEINIEDVKPCINELESQQYDDLTGTEDYFIDAESDNPVIAEHGKLLISKENIPIFRQRLERVVIRKHQEHVEEFRGNDKPNIQMLFRANPLSIKAKLTCNLCHRSISITPRCTKNKLFVGWFVNSYHRHLAKMHKIGIFSKKDDEGEIYMDEDETPNYEIQKTTVNFDFYLEGGTNDGDSDANNQVWDIGPKSIQRKMIKENIPYFKQTLINGFRNVVKTSGISNVQNGPHSVSIGFFDYPPFLKSKFSCFVCGKSFNANCQIKSDGDFRQWVLFPYKRHLMKFHKAVNTVSIPSVKANTHPIQYSSQIN